MSRRGKAGLACIAAGILLLEGIVLFHVLQKLLFMLGLGISEFHLNGVDLDALFLKMALDQFGLLAEHGYGLGIVGADMGTDFAIVGHKGNGQRAQFLRMKLQLKPCGAVSER